MREVKYLCNSTLNFPQRFCADPVYVIIDVRPGVEGIPTTAYKLEEEVEADGKEIQASMLYLKLSVSLPEVFFRFFPANRELESLGKGRKKV